MRDMGRFATAGSDPAQPHRSFGLSLVAFLSRSRQRSASWLRHRVRLHGTKTPDHRETALQTPHDLLAEIRQECA